MASQMEIIDLISKPAYCPPPAPDLSIMVRIHPTKTQKDVLLTKIKKIQTCLMNIMSQKHTDVDEYIKKVFKIIR